MTIAEKRHEQLEQRVAAALEEQGLTLHRQGGLYQVIDGDNQPVTGLCTLAEIIEAWG